MTGEPMHRASISIENARIVAVGDAVADGTDLGHTAVMPALVNAHTHLELSYLRGQIPRTQNFVDWIRTVIAARRRYADPADPDIVDAARAAIGEAHATGTGLVGDISNTLVTAPLLREASLPAQMFHELLRFNAADAESMTRDARAKADAAADPDGHVRVSLAPHAPYSVSPALFAAIRADLDAHSGQVTSVHLGESLEETEFIRHGSGPWRVLLEELGVWTDAWHPPGTSPVAYLEEIGFLDRRVLAVHGVQFDGDDLDRLRTRDMTIVSCPRSNQYVGVGAPPLEAFYAMKVNVALGTDSLASAPDLNMFAELAEARRLAPRVPARTLLESATRRGAAALGFADDYGTLEVGKRAQIIAVAVPPDVSDVEEYLVSGIEPSAIQWLETD
ncbi:MAG TPA: amidohydrolase family protein [Vicinamibacterales bacterium]|nr:amidohydrolase family protein [Vicinamibacterales bacterium]